MISAKSIVKEYVETTKRKFITESVVGSQSQALGKEKYGKFYSQSNLERRFRELKSEGVLSLTEVKENNQGHKFRFTTWRVN